MTTKNKGKANRCNSPGKVDETNKSSSDNRDFHKRPDNSQGKNKNRLRGHNSNHNLDGNDQKRLCRCRRRRFNKLSLSTNKERTKFPDDSNVGSSDLPTNTENASLNSNHNGTRNRT